MNLKEIELEDTELPVNIIKEGVSSLLHTLLFLRAPNQIKACDEFIPKLGLCYLKCGNGINNLQTSDEFVPVIASEEVEESVILALKSMLNCLTTVGPNLYRGIIIISFYEYRSSRSFLGLMNNLEKVVFERWKIPILVNENIIPSNNPITNPNMEILQARENIQSKILQIIEFAGYVDHVPNSYEYAIEAGFSGEKREASMVAKLINSPSLLSNLS